MHVSEILQHCSGSQAERSSNKKGPRGSLAGEFKVGRTSALAMNKCLQVGSVLGVMFALSAEASGVEPTAAYQAQIADAARLESLAQWSASGDAYMSALRLQPDAPDGEAVAMKAVEMHSSFNDLGCFWKRIDKPGNGPVPIEGQLAKLFAAYDLYLNLFPSAKMAPKIRYRKASHLEECRYFSEAADLYRQVYEGSPDRELARYARAGYRRVRMDGKRFGKSGAGARSHKLGSE
jgi:hypothetical protein